MWDDVIKVTSIPSGSKMSVGEHKFQFHDERSSVASSNSMMGGPVLPVKMLWRLTAAGQAAHAHAKALNRFKQTGSGSDSFSFCQQSEGRFSQLLDAVGTVGRAHGGHEFLFQKWVDNEVLNDFNVVIHNCAL